MNRRHFLAATGAAATFSQLHAAIEEEVELDWEKVVQVNHHVAVCEQATNGKFPDIKLEVRLERKDPESQWSTVITQFKLTWEGQDIPIAARFWNDLDHLSIQTYPDSEIRKIPEPKRWQLLEKLERLKQPRLILSAENGTLLIEWVRGEECDSHSTIRWIITRAGVVLRHRHEPYHLC